MKRILCISALAALVIAGCVKKKDFDFKNVTIDNWQPDWALPILNSNLTLKNVVKKGTVVTEDAEGLYSLHYTGALFSAKASDYIFIPDQAYSTPVINLSIPQSMASFSGSFSDSFSNHYTYSDTSGAQLSHINLKDGNIALTINSTFRHNVNATVIFPSVLNNGVPLQVAATIAYPATSSTVNIGLSGYNFDLTNGGTSKNYLPYKVRFSLSGTGESLNAGDHLSADLSLSNLKYSFVDGFLGTYNIPMPADTIYVGVFDNTLTANVFIRNPKINLAFNNSFGLGVAAKFDDIYGLTNKGVRVNMVVPPVSVAGAGTAGQTAVTNYTIDTTNSTVQNMFNPAPNHVIYDGRVMVNPGGAGSTYNFVTDQSEITLNAEAELPAWFNIIDFSLQDTFKMILPEDTSVLQKAEFKMLMDNAFPLYGRVQLYFADENYNYIDSLVPTASDIVAEAPVDANGHVTGRSSAITTFTMEHSEYNAMAPKVRYAVIRGTLKTSGSNDIKILSSNNLIVKLAFRFKLNVSSTDL
jgi:hypothetical protein